MPRAARLNPRTLRTTVSLLLSAALMAPAMLRGEPAADAPRTDPVLQLLRERGLLPAAPAAAGADRLQQLRDTASDLVLAAMNFIGVPYRAGGNGGEQGFDCSGFTRHVFEHTLGLVLPRRADDQAHASGLVRIGREELRPGDLVFFNTLRRTFSHVGIYVGDGRFIHAPRTGSDVRIEDMRQAYWERRFTGARRAAVPADMAPSKDTPPGRETR
jgi:cell wall-associated NlpC family hydrolase